MAVLVDGVHAASGEAFEIDGKSFYVALAIIGSIFYSNSWHILITACKRNAFVLLMIYVVMFLGVKEVRLTTSFVKLAKKSKELSHFEVLM